MCQYFIVIPSKFELLFDQDFLFSSPLGYALIPSTKSDNFSDSSHSEISSRSSIVSNCSVDSMSAALQDERSLSQSLIVVDSGGAERKEHPQPLTDYSQPYPG